LLARIYADTTEEQFLFLAHVLCRRIRVHRGCSIRVDPRELLLFL
jgi:hypothetical protein